MMVNLLFIRPDRYSQASLLIRHMNRTMPLSKEMEELLALLITLVFAALRWMIAGPEVSRVVEEFHKELDYSACKTNTGHHDQAPIVQATFGKDVLSLINVMEDLGNPFEEESTNLLVLDSKEIADHAAVEMVKNIRRIGQEHFQTFVKEYAIDDVIHRNKLKLFKSTTQNSLSKGMLQLASLKCDVELFSRLYIGCQTRGQYRCSSIFCICGKRFRWTS